MIGVGIIGCSGLRATELIRILINHPDVELRWVSDVPHAGMRLDRIVPGIVGESDLAVVPQGDLEEVDLVYLIGSRDKVELWLRSAMMPVDLRIIDLSGFHNLDCGTEGKWTYGLSEMQRRVLVHDARWVTVPGTAAAASLLTVMPLARNQLLGSGLALHVSVGTAVCQAAGLDGVIDTWTDEQEREVRHALRQCQPGFSQPVSLAVDVNDDRRLVTVEARFKVDTDLDALRSLYQQYYEDHNFVFLMDRAMGPADVENTNKCLLRLSHDEASGEMTVTGVMDGLLKGGVGNAVHSMNLMFGLYECIGLMLKASGC